jgi:phosphoenolpyruvate carboxykinase (GTP)
VPTPESLDTTGLDMDAAVLERALRVDAAEWVAEVPQIQEWFDKIGEKLPTMLLTELDALKARLGMG